MPTNYLSVENLTKSYGEKKLFQELTFGIEQGQKAALVGVNGCGKTTLLKIIAGEETPDTGKVTFQNDLVIAYLDQAPQFNPGDTIADAVFDTRQEEAVVLKQYHQLLSEKHHTEEEQKELQILLDKIEALQAWDFEHNAETILSKLGLDDVALKVGNLSGGQQKRIALARVLVRKPDFLMMDEPTNHLDLDVIEWLEDYLSTQNLSLLMVTHDRYFLDKISNKILEIEKGQIFSYDGNYTRYLEQKAERETLLQKEKEKAQNLMKKELEWMRRQPKARTTKAKFRENAFYELQDKASVNLKKDKLDIRISEKRQGKKILELENVSKSFDSKLLFKDFSYIFSKGEKIGIVGNNGTGKTTFLNVITQKLQPDSGEIETGVNTNFGFYTQTGLEFNEDQKVIEAVTDIAEVITLADGNVITASQFLNLFLFPPSRQHDFIRKLSGGEKRRLQLLQVLIRNPNFLILDEPTNDLDIVTLNVLEDYLANFKGCLLLVSHDRYFMDRLVDHLFVFDDSSTVKNFIGNYTEYRAAKTEQQKKETTKSEKPKKEKPKPKNPKKLSFKEQQELKSLDEKIPKLEQRKSELINNLNAGSGNHEELTEWAKEIKTITEKLDELEMRWLELSEKE